MSKLYFFFGSKSQKADEVEALYIEYKNGDEFALSDAIRILDKPLRHAAVSASNSTSRAIPSDVFLSEMYEAVWRAFDHYEEEKAASFTTYLVEAVNRAIACVMTDRVAGGHVKYANNTQLMYEGCELSEGSSGIVATVEHCDGFTRVANGFITYAQVNEITSGRNVEAEVIDKLMVNEQRDLIDYLYEKAPDHVRAYIEEMYDRGELRFNPKKKENPDKPKQEEIEEKTFTQIAKKFGVHHSKVTRGIRSLRGFYDVKKFGDLYDYLYRVRG